MRICGYRTQSLVLAQPSRQSVRLLVRSSGTVPVLECWAQDESGMTFPCNHNVPHFFGVLQTEQPMVQLPKIDLTLDKLALAHHGMLEVCCFDQNKFEYKVPWYLGKMPLN